MKRTLQYFGLFAVVGMLGCGLEGAPEPQPLTPPPLTPPPKTAKGLHQAQGESASVVPVQDVGGGQCCFVSDEPVCPCF